MGYRELVDEAIQLFGSERAVGRMLGFAGHGTLAYRLEHPKTIKREHIIALETLISRVKYHQKFPFGFDNTCNCGGKFGHVRYTHKDSHHWQTFKCDSCQRMLVREVLKKDDDE